MLHTDDIWAELTRRRIKAKDIANDLEVATSTVTRAINGDTRTPAPHILEFIADRIGVTVSDLCPGRPAHRQSEDSGKRPQGSMVNGKKAQTCPGHFKGASRSQDTSDQGPQDSEHTANTPSNGQQVAA